MWEGPFVTQLGLVQSKRASSRMEAGTSGVLSISDSGRRVPAEYGQESHASQNRSPLKGNAHSGAFWEPSCGQEAGSHPSLGAGGPGPWAGLTLPEVALTSAHLSPKPSGRWRRPKRWCARWTAGRWWTRWWYPPRRQTRSSSLAEGPWSG